MTTKEYLQQAYRLDKRINSHIKELEELKSMAAAISSPQITADKVQTTPSGDPPYVSALMRIWEMEEKINAEIDLYVDLKAQIHSVLKQVSNPDYLRANTIFCGEKSQSRTILTPYRARKK